MGAVLDADEFVDTVFCDALADALREDKFDAFWLSYTNFFLDEPLRYGVQQQKLALFRVGKALYERVDENTWSELDMEIHEHPIVAGSVGNIEVPIEHRDYKGLEKFIKKHSDYATWEAHRFARLRQNREPWENFTPRQRFKYRHLAKWWYPLLYFLFTYLAKRGFLDGSAGFHYAFYKAWYFYTIRLLIREQSAN